MPVELALPIPTVISPRLDENHTDAEEEPATPAAADAVEDTNTGGAHAVPDTLETEPSSSAV